MTFQSSRRFGAFMSTAALAIAAAAFSSPAAAADAPAANVTVANVNVLNLLSPFLSLNGTDIGHQTLALNLSQTVAVNNNAASVAVLNGHKDTLTVEELAISDKNLFGSVSNSITIYSYDSATQKVSTTTKGGYGVAANLAGGLPATQGTIGNGLNPVQAVGGYGSALGAAYQAGVGTNTSGTTITLANVPMKNTASLLTTAYSFTSSDAGVAKAYFANGSVSTNSPTLAATAAVAPAGYTLPAGSGIRAASSSVYDTEYVTNGAYVTSNNGTIIDKPSYGDARPVQVSADINGFDPTALTGLATNPAFPSGHTTYAYTDSILLGMLVPERFDSMLLRASEYANSRIVLGVHYALDIIASRSFVQYELAQLLTATDPAYQNTNTVGSTTALNFQQTFANAYSDRSTLLSLVNSQNGTSFTSIADVVKSSLTTANDPYAYSAENAATYRARLTYGLPTTAIAKELTDTHGKDASILLVTVYGGDSTAAKTIEGLIGTSTTGGIYGNLSTDTIKQIIANTEVDAITAFVGTDLSYWSRINLYDAANYFIDPKGITTKLLLASGDKLNVPVTVGNGGVFGGSGTVTGDVTIKSGGAFGAKGSGTTSYQGLTVNGTTDFKAGSKVQLTGVFLPGTTYTLLNSTAIDYNGSKLPAGAVSSISVDTSSSGNLMTLFTGKLSVVGDPQLQVILQSHFANAAQTQNQKSVASAIDTAGNAGNFGTTGAQFLNALIANNTVATAPSAFTSLGGEGITGQQQTALNAGNLFVTTVLGQATFWADDRRNDVFGLKDGGSASLKDEPGYEGAIASRGRIWASGFGQYATLDGETGVGSADLSNHTSGVAGGIDYQATKNLLVGIAGGFSNSNFSVNDRATTGVSEGGHIALYSRATWGNFYGASTIAYGHFDNKTTRFVDGLGSVDKLRGTFSSDEWISRFEAGYKYNAGGVTVTPFAGYQLAQLSNDAFSETGVGSNLAALRVSSVDIDSDKAFLGIQIDTKTTLNESWVLTPYARVSWEHEFNADRYNKASFIALPGSTFRIDGASAAEDVARVNAGFKLDISKDVAVFAAFDGEFSERGESYAGTGGVRIRW
ncbi:autotransporter domain-containing protein [Rhodomicrobium lacus]|uniref:autotransporter family protein n=1 Tax=Rhodomicrobium lacus TaxID=2498452 RepID=UPI000F8C5534|nr:autotransporter domain-containing protein [Rhodomicrobium lacus]